MNNDKEILRETVRHALSLGADVAGTIPAAMLINCPSADADGNQGSVRDQGTYIILGLFHDPATPEMDYWEEGRGTPGDRQLGAIGRELAGWLHSRYGITAELIPYQLYDGGIYLKDAAVLAGIGIMGRNNLVQVPGFGPRIRFRAVWADIESDPPAPVDLTNPCPECPGYCISTCPMRAFETGGYSRERCMQRMDADKNRNSEMIDHCRACELACP
jgi:ferredoxin